MTELENSLITESSGKDVETEFNSSSDASVMPISVPREGSSMGDMLEYIARAIVSDPDVVKVAEESTDDGLVLRLAVGESDKGKVIGRSGRVAQAIRSLLRVAATKSGTRVSLIIE